jgi:carbon storage regulator
MFLVRRRAGQSIRIGDHIEIHIADLSPSKVTIGIDAPREVAVMRSEVALTRDQNLAAADSLTADSLAKLANAIRLIPDSIHKIT